jgi:hypothetical protein
MEARRAEAQALPGLDHDRRYPQWHAQILPQWIAALNN